MRDGEKVVLAIIIICVLFGVGSLLVIGHAANQIAEIVATGVAGTPTP